MVVADLCFKTTILHGKACPVTPVEIYLQSGMNVAVSSKAFVLLLRATVRPVVDAACECTHSLPLADDAIFKLPVRHPTYIVSHRYRLSDSACCTPCSQGPAPSCRASVTQPPEEVCVSGRARRASVIRKLVCSNSTTEGEFAKSVMRLK